MTAELPKRATRTVWWSPRASIVSGIKKKKNTHTHTHTNAPLHTIVIWHMSGPVGAVLIIVVGCRINLPLCSVPPVWST